MTQQVSDQDMLRLIDRYHQARRAAEKAVEGALLPGRIVRWRHGRSEREGIIVMVHACLRHGRVKVLNPNTGREYWIDLWAVVDGLK